MSADHILTSSGNDCAAPSVLIADDDPVVRAVLTAHIRKRGHAVVAVGDGLEALAYAADHQVDIMITDLEMPGLGGLELIDRLRHEQPLARVIVVTGYGTLANSMACLSAGAFTLVTKPLGDCTGIDRAVEHAAWVLADWRTQLTRMVRMGRMGRAPDPERVGVNSVLNRNTRP